MRFKRQAVKARSSGSGLGGRLVWLLRIAWRPCLVWVLPWIVLVVVCGAGLSFCKSTVEELPEYRAVAKLSLSGQTRPPWWEKAFEDQINQTCAFANGASMLDDSLLPRMAAAYGRCPWVKRVRWVRKEFPGTISTQIDVRGPAAAVAVRTARGMAYYLVGDDGVALPRAYTQWPQPGLTVPVITGVCDPAPAPGKSWPGRSVMDAMQIVRLLRSNEVVRKAVNITEVDVSNCGGRISRTQSEFVLKAENNCVVEWGRAPDSVNPGELHVHEKIAKFARFLADGNPTGNRTLDLRFAGRVVVSRRIAADGNNS